jgi:hypothetical protein
VARVVGPRWARRDVSATTLQQLGCDLDAERINRSDREVHEPGMHLGLAGFHAVETAQIHVRADPSVFARIEWERGVAPADEPEPHAFAPGPADAGADVEPVTVGTPALVAVVDDVDPEILEIRFGPDHVWPFEPEATTSFALARSQWEHVRVDAEQTVQVRRRRGLEVGETPMRSLLIVRRAQKEPSMLSIESAPALGGYRLRCVEWTLREIRRPCLT